MHSPSSATTTILLILVSVAFSTCYSQLEEEPYFTCVHNFSCGPTIQNVSYPFWGGDHPKSCGHPSFKLTCHNNEYPTLEIDNRPFRVHTINQSSKTIALTSSDLWDSFCTQELHNITLDYNLFAYGPLIRYLFLFYNCISAATTFSIPNNFTCEIGGIDRLGLYTDEAFLSKLENFLSTTITCDKSVEVQVFRDTVDKLLEGSLELIEGLRRGFELVYRADDFACATCVSSGGICGWN